MDRFKCQICEKTFSKYGNYKRHIEDKKKPCIKKDEFIENKQCKYCNKFFVRRDYLFKHLEKCKNKDKVDIGLNKDKCSDKEIEEIRKINILNSNINSNNITNININNNITNNNITINNIHFQLTEYGNEDYNKINLANVLDSGSIMLKVIEEIHCNPENPEYHNILITDKNRNIVNVFRQNGWSSESKNIVTKGLINRTYLHLVDLKEKLVKKYKQQIEDEIQKFIFNQLDDYYLEHRRILNQRINNIIYDKRDMVKDTYEKHKQAKKLREKKLLEQKYYLDEYKEQIEELSDCSI